MHPLIVATVATIAVALVVHAVPPAKNVRPWREEPGPPCELPPRSCADLSATKHVRAGFCDELVHMPHEGVGFRDRRLPGEQTAATSTSYLRRDLAMAIAYAAARVDCKAAGWRSTSDEPIELGDMSERDGGIPGTREGLPRHPLGTHVGGHDIDIAYYQRDTPDNRIRAICEHELAGIDQHHCVAPPNMLDARRTALFLGSLLEESRIRAIGIDGAAASPILAAFDQLCREGWIRPYACRPDRIQYETAETRRGWYRFHHAHLHVSWLVPRFGRAPPTNGH